MNYLTWLAAAALATSGCTAVNQARLPSQNGPGQVFITQESVEGPYESLGVIQLTRRGVILFGWGDIVGTDLEQAIEEIRPQIRKAGADGMMNMRILQTQYTTTARVFGAIFFFAPLAAEVTITGELVKLKDSTAALRTTESQPAALASGGTP
jgi:hypothetical protein